jgi:AraC-like DNA-binding protein
MQYLARTPGPPLGTFIKRIWYCAEAPSGALLLARERVLPGGHVDLIINLADDVIRTYDAGNTASMQAHAGALIRGTHTRSHLADSGQRTSVMGVHFRPGGAFPFLGVSPSELVDDHVPLADLWREGGRSLREQLIEAPSASERFRLLEAALLRRLRHARAGHPAARIALDAFRAGGGAARVADIASMVGLSHRGFIEIFKREVGLTPKVYARLQRFHGAKERIAALGAPASWATFAIECGYFDQSHMIRDFAAFSGISPTGYLKSRSGETMFDHFVHSYGRPAQAQREARTRPA